jgi:hypothetical protein
MLRVPSFHLPCVCGQSLENSVLTDYLASVWYRKALMLIVETEGLEAANALSGGGVQAAFEKGNEDFRQILSDPTLCKFFKHFAEQVSTCACLCASPDNFLKQFRCLLLPPVFPFMCVHRLGVLPADSHVLARR